MENQFATGINGLFESTSWLQFDILLLGIAAFLLAVKLVIFILDNLSRQSSFATSTRKALEFVLEHIEPFLILTVIAYFISINFVLHTLIVILLVVGGYRQIRDYITGMALRYNGALLNGSNISIGDVHGEIENLRRLGVHIKSKDASHFYSYAKLYDKGFTIHANDAFGGYYPLKVKLTGNEQSLSQLRSIIINSPFSDEYNTVRIDNSDDFAKEATLSVHLRKTAHLEDLKILLRSKGYECPK